MLLSFRFANHLSFRDEQQLNFIPEYDSEERRLGDFDSVRIIGIFGANASGKSNCLRALEFMRRTVVWSDREVERGLGNPQAGFCLDAESRDSRYVVDMMICGVRHTYGFVIKGSGVVEEWLYHYPLEKRHKVFDREGSEFCWSEELGERGELEKIACLATPKTLFLSTAARFGVGATLSGQIRPEPVHDVYRWFDRIRTRARLDSNRLRRIWLGHEQDQRVVLELLKVADTGIIGMSRDRHGRGELRFLHRGSDDNVSLTLAQESTGIQRLLHLAIDVAYSLRVGGVMAVDDIDTSLHPILTAKLIGLFKSPTTNPRGSQLIFTSHDGALLGTIDGEEVLRRDEIWFTEKQNDGASVLYPLSDFKPRKAGENRQRRYLNGNYGAVPNLSTYLFERAVASRDDLSGDTC